MGKKDKAIKKETAGEPEYKGAAKLASATMEDIFTNAPAKKAVKEKADKKKK